MAPETGPDTRGKGAFVFTVDVEDWFQVENFKPWIPFESWPHRELRVEKNIHGLLDLLDGGGQRREATFFVLGWLAERYPHLVREIYGRGHEIASHGFNHHLPAMQTRKALREDLLKSRTLLEDLIGERVWGYRAPSFAVNEEVLALIQECGYLYDSSYNSFDRHGRYGRLDVSGFLRRGIAIKLQDDFYEVPVSNLTLGDQVIPWGGGGYFRMIPARLYAGGVRRQMNRDGAFVFYTHPWELDPGQPRVKGASAQYAFRHYINLNRTAGKLAHCLQALGPVRFTGCRNYLRLMGDAVACQKEKEAIYG
ncbi:XrtA system polysaccharide deacetylase [Desulfoluna spongiiphila]|uniref:Polysaccharide deacetylase family protein, PEP-CTERM locus subfamily n=1 Tax=Desulfoluna spongiiphila TaxID=419481 RepID=A0A1G5BYE5_9BACT|nr:XrtA system polysaccharide deacetylase [Desulfoluna spongiiphila]SCX95215.1 polysaccharide deacetylase family protein, PEP-CTERM locus subfamily [Desulfoluna spongiiphila]